MNDCSLTGYLHEHAGRFETAYLPLSLRCCDFRAQDLTQRLAGDAAPLSILLSAASRVYAEMTDELPCTALQAEKQLAFPAVSFKGGQLHCCGGTQQFVSGLTCTAALQAPPLSTPLTIALPDFPRPHTPLKCCVESSAVNMPRDVTENGNGDQTSPPNQVRHAPCRAADDADTRASGLRLTSCLEVDLETCLHVLTPVKYRSKLALSLLLA